MRFLLSTVLEQFPGASMQYRKELQNRQPARPTRVLHPRSSWGGLIPEAFVFRPRWPLRPYGLLESPSSSSPKSATPLLAHKLLHELLYDLLSLHLPGQFLATPTIFPNILF